MGSTNAQAGACPKKLFYFFLLVNPHLRTFSQWLFREDGREIGNEEERAGERNMDEREIHQPVASHMLGVNPKPRFVPLTRN